MAASVRPLAIKSSCFRRTSGLQNVIISHIGRLCANTFSSQSICFGKAYTFIETEDSEFRILHIPGHSQLPSEQTEKRKFANYMSVNPRSAQMVPDQDWTSVWPTAQSFKWSVVPLPLRQGVSRKSENDGIPLGKYGNAEMMKIPNFLHLTPPHVKKHCQALKKFCTAWPEGLETDAHCDAHFPITAITSDYILDRPTPRDARARKVSIQVKLSSLMLDDHAREKLLRIVGDRYDKETDTLTITADRCPVRRQNFDYVNYLLTVLYYESWKTEPWEEERSEAEMDEFQWDGHYAQKALLATINNAKRLVEQPKEPKKSEAGQDKPMLGSIPLNIDIAEEDLLARPEVIQYQEAVECLQNEGETLHTVEKYKQAAVKLLLGVHPENK